MTSDEIQQGIHEVKLQLVKLSEKLQQMNSVMNLILDDYNEMIEFIKESDDEFNYRAYRRSDLPAGHATIVVLGELVVDEEE